MSQVLVSVVVVVVVVLLLVVLALLLRVVLHHYQRQQGLADGSSDCGLLCEQRALSPFLRWRVRLRDGPVPRRRR
jgi:hypothetical protein